MKKLLAFIVLVVMLSSCEAYKEVAKKSNDKFNEQTQTERDINKVKMHYYNYRVATAPYNYRR